MYFNIRSNHNYILKEMLSVYLTLLLDFVVCCEKRGLKKSIRKKKIRLDKCLIKCVVELFLLIKICCFIKNK